MTAGRTAGGADPPECFQLFTTGYVQFFNETNPDCDSVYFSVPATYPNPSYLTRDLRKEMNSMVVSKQSLYLNFLARLTVCCLQDRYALALSTVLGNANISVLTSL